MALAVVRSKLFTLQAISNTKPEQLLTSQTKTPSHVAIMQTIFTLSLAALAALSTAAPAVRRQNTPTASKGFTLVAKVTDPSKDFSPSVDNWVFSTIHTGPPTSRAVLSQGNSRIFYENGTSADVAAGTTTLITDSATPPTPFGVTIQGPTEYDVTYPTEHSIFVNAGTGTLLSVGGGFLANGLDRGTGDEGTFVACNNTVPYYRDLRFITLQYVYDGETAPQGCAPVVLVPQCATLNDLPPDAYASHEFALDVGCYQNVSALSWSWEGDYAKRK